MKINLLSLLFCCGVVPAIAAPDLSELNKVLGGRTPDFVSETPISSLYEVGIDGQIIYLSEDGRYVLQGEMIELSSRSNLTEQRRADARRIALDNLQESEMVIFSPAAESVKHTVTIFTDIDCGYCRRMHQEIESYLAQGIKVRYLAFPRSGPGTESFDKAVSVWCSDDTLDAMTRAKLGQSIESRTCPNPVENQYELGQQLGIRGTPSILLENGEIIPGYLPAERLAATLRESAN